MQPAHKYAGAHTGTVVLGGLFTSVAIAYSATRATTQGRALVGKHKRAGNAPAVDDDLGASPMVTTQPPKKDSLWYQARVAAVEAGAIPASALYEMDDSDEEDAMMGEERGDERTGTRYNVRLVPSAISLLQSLTSAAVLVVPHHLRDGIDVRRHAPCRLEGSPYEAGDEPDYDIYIGRSEMAMWMRVVSNWIYIVLYAWSLLAPLAMPDRFDDWE